MEFTQRFIFADTDLNAETINRAFYWTSFDPDKRVKTEREMYVSDMESCKEKLILAAKTDEQKEEAVKCFEYIKTKWLSLRNIYYSAQSRCASSAVTGGSGFNVSRANKANNVSHDREGEFWTWRENALNIALARVNRISDDWKAKGAIKSNDNNALELLNQKLADLKTLQNVMKIQNNLKLRTVEEFLKIEGATLEAWNELLSCVKVWNTNYTFPSYYLTSNNGKIKGAKQRLLEVSKKQQAVTKEVARESGVTIVENVEADRLQMLFNGKPSVAIISDLKKNGFRWSPTNSAWQAFLTPNAKWKCENICKTHNL